MVCPRVNYPRNGIRGIGRTFEVDQSLGMSVGGDSHNSEGMPVGVPVLLKIVNQWCVIAMCTLYYWQKLGGCGFTWPKSGAAEVVPATPLPMPLGTT